MAKTTKRTWMLTAEGGSPRLFEMTLPASKVPQWDPPVGSATFDPPSLWLYIDGKLVGKGTTWAEVLAQATA